MSNNKIIFVDPRTVCSYKQDISELNIREPLGMEYIASVANNEGFDSDIIMQISPKSDEIISKILSEKPAIVGISCMTYNIKNGLEIAQEIKSHLPKTIIILGGEHPSACPEIAKNKYIDYVVIGEGEETFKELLSYIKLGYPKIEEIKGLAYFKDNELQINQLRERIKDLDSLPFPYRTKEIINKCIDGGIAYPPPSEQKSTAMISYSRGCLFDCSFCTSPQMWQRKLIYRSAKNVVDEIEILKNEFNTNYIFFADFTFNANKNKIYEFCNELKKKKVEINWCCQARADLVDEKFLDEIKEAGCRRISYGVESLDDYSLRTINKKEKLEHIISTFKLTNQKGLLTRATYMIGYPWQKRESFEDMKKRITMLPADEVRMNFYTIFPGTTDWKRYQNLLLTNDTNLFDTNHITVRTKDNISEEELQKFRKDILKIFVESEDYEKRMNKKIKMRPEYKNSYYGYLETLQELLK